MILVHLVSYPNLRVPRVGDRGYILYWSLDEGWVFEKDEVTSIHACGRGLLIALKERGLYTFSCFAENFFESYDEAEREMYARDLMDEEMEPI